MLIKKIFHRVSLFCTDWRWWPFFFQRNFTDPKLRGKVSDFIGKNIRPPSTYGSPSGNQTLLIDELRSAGIAHMGQLLSESQCRELRDYFSSLFVYDPYRESLPHFLPLDEGKRFEKTHIAHHQPKDVLLAPYIMELANSNRILEIVSGFLGCKPLISYIAVWWSYHVQSGAQEAEFFHRDVDDWRFVKLFVYLDDVRPENGPHVYVKYSSRVNKLMKIRRFTDEEVIHAFGVGNIIQLPADAGKGFLEDTYGIHKGQPVGIGRRLVLQVVYSLSPLPYSPSKPVQSQELIAKLGFDPWINKIYFG